MVYHIAQGKPLTKGAISYTYEMLDGDYDRIEYLDSSQDDGCRISTALLEAGRPIDGTHVPTRLRRTGPSPKKQPLLEVDFAVGSLIVNEDFKDVIERFEPGVHQFFPLTIEQRNKVIGERFLFIICNRLDTLHRELTVPKVEPGRLYRAARDGNDRKVFDRSRLGSHHAWFEKFTLGRYVSNDVFNALQDAGITNIGHKKYDEA